MTSQSRIDANRINAQASTGPRTPEGKARCSGNAASLGLFCARAFVRPGETDEYDQLRSGLMAELAPRSLMEQTHATEILNSMWRLRRCSLVEAEMALESTDPMASQTALPTQNAVDRARAHAGNTIRRSTTELRRLQTERLLQSQLGRNDGLASHKDAAATLVSEARRAILMRKLDDLHTVEGSLESLFSGNPPTAITKQSQQDPPQDPEADLQSFFDREAENFFSAITKQTEPAAADRIPSPVTMQPLPPTPYLSRQCNEFVNSDARPPFELAPSHPF